MQETALSSQSCHNPRSGSRTLGRKHLLTTGCLLSSRRASRAAPRAARGAPLPQGLCTGTMGGQQSPQCYPAGERQVPPVFISAPSPTPSETPHAVCALPLRQSRLAILCQTCSCPGTPQNDYSPPFTLLKCSGVPTASPHSRSPQYQHCRTPNCTAAPLCSLL